MPASYLSRYDIFLSGHAEVSILPCMSSSAYEADLRIFIVRKMVVNIQPIFTIASVSMASLIHDYVVCLTYWRTTCIAVTTTTFVLGIMRRCIFLLQNATSLIILKVTITILTSTVEHKYIPNLL